MGLTVEKCLQAWTNSLRQMNAKAEIVFFGDSLIYYGEFASLFPNKVVCNLGLRGDSLMGMKNRVEQVKLLKPRNVCLMAGINDVANYSVKAFREKYELLIKELKGQVPTVNLIIFSMLPVNNLSFSISCNNEMIAHCNGEIASLCIIHGLYYVDLFTVYEQNGLLPSWLTKDGLHLTLNGYNKWYNKLREINFD